MKQIALTKGKFALVDDEDFEKLNSYKWYATKNGTKYYASKGGTMLNGKSLKKVYMHRFILNNPTRLVVDHIDGNSLNNQKFNLRQCTKRQNSLNQGKNSNNKSGYKGVCYFKGVFIAQISINKKNTYLGRFKTKDEAYEAYCKACTKYHGEYARLK